ncbi:hydroxysqualene dehydroxylase HpnE [Chitinilyticum litopenaei]|uniref:hydroxysqualene dehydroxylase HpnE n=1 Tax=Chitinilyticum litopenaei TaxID=1121276 RepID=UPI0004057DEB|nr:hydroxysqualene dehydroxylase HpnE [Chitinilyticum litopenaei]
MTASRIAIIGGGYAGMAAAVTLAAAGARVCVFEGAKTLGGRARAVELDGRLLDNGQHILIGAYRTLLGLMQQVGVAEATALLRLPLTLQQRVPRGEARGDFRMVAPDWPAPLHSLGALLGAQGLAWREKFSLARLLLQAQLGGFRLKQDGTVLDWLRAGGQSPALIERFWQPLTVAALNTPLESASAQVLLTVLRDSLLGARRDGDLLIPRIDFTALFPQPAADWLAQRDGEVRCSTPVRALAREEAGWRINDGAERFAAVVLAVSPQRASALLPEQAALAPLRATLSAFRYQPIQTVYLQYAETVRLDLPMQGVAGGLCQWVFDRGRIHGTPGLLAVVLSARGAYSDWDAATLAGRVHAELQQFFALDQAPRWHRVIHEKRATFACTPGLPRPGNASGVAGLWLAGDYTASADGNGDYPATLEAAARSGVAAAQGVLRETGML